VENSRYADPHAAAGRCRRDLMEGTRRSGRRCIAPLKFDYRRVQMYKSDPAQ
jgi:hypothetical protein